jgi:anthranilate phosphoribosyltransferase
MEILEGRGTRAQQAIVVANAGMALFGSDRKSGIESAIAKAKESLESGRARETFKKLLNKSGT